MGLFLSVSGVISASADEVRRALAGFVSERGGDFQPRPGATPDEENLAVIASRGANTVVVYPEFFDYVRASEHLASALSVPVFALHIHDEDLWMFELFYAGQTVTRFNPIPDYWGEVEADEKASWAGDASAVERVVPGVTAEQIERYLLEWTDANAFQVDVPIKAYEDDEFPIGDCWQMLDFMRKLGLFYPVSEAGAIEGEPYRLSVPESPGLAGA